MTHPLSSPADLLALAERVEKAEGPDRRMDAAIARLQGLRIVEEGHPLGRCCYDADHRLTVIPSYTRSIDAAMTLVPEGWRIFGADFSIEGRFQWTLKGPLVPWSDNDCDQGRVTPSYVSGIAPTPAQAFTAAALKARALSHKDTIS